MTTRRRILRTAAATVIAAGLVAGSVAIAATGTPRIDIEPLALTTNPEPSAVVTACSGPLLALGRDQSDASLLTDAEAPDTVAGTLRAAGEVTQSQLAAPDVTDGAGPTVFEVAPVGRSRIDAAAAQSRTVNADDLRGFAASGCAAPRMESWVAAGSAATGAADLLLISNPGDVAATADITVYTVEGETSPVAGRAIVIPPRTQRVVPVAALAIGEESPVLKVTATSAPLLVSVQASITRTLVPGGLDVASVTATPHETLTIPGVVVGRSSSTEAGDAPTVLRLLSPDSEADVLVDVQRVGGGSTDGSVSSAAEVHLAPGQPLELELGALDPGTYVVRLVSTVPVTGAVRTSTGSTDSDDFGWVSAADALGDSTMVAVARGPGAMLTLTADEGADATVQLIADEGAGATEELVIPASGAVQVDVAGGEVYEIVTVSGNVRGAVSYYGEGALASYPVTPGAATSEAMTVYPQ